MNNWSIKLNRQDGMNLIEYLRLKEHDYGYRIESVNVNKISITKHKCVLVDVIGDVLHVSLMLVDDKIGDSITLKAEPDVIDKVCKRLGEFMIDFNIKEGVVIRIVDVQDVLEGKEGL